MNLNQDNVQIKQKEIQIERNGKRFALTEESRGINRLFDLIPFLFNIKTKNKILLIEDIGENLYAIDRMLVQLERSGKLDEIVGVVSGGFTDIKDTERPYGKTIEGIILEFFKERKIPICFDFPVGHQPQNFAIKLGVEYDFKVSATGVSLTEQR